MPKPGQHLAEEIQFVLSPLESTTLWQPSASGNTELLKTSEYPKPGSLLIGAPGFEPGTSPTRTVRATRLRHAPRGVIISERRTGRGEGLAPLLWTGRRFHSMKMARRLIPILVVALLAMVPAAARAYLPPGFIGVSP